MIGLSVIILIVILAVALFLVGRRNNQADWGHWATNALDGLIRVFCRRYHRQGSQTLKIPTDPHVLIAANHLSGMDPFILITASKRPIRFMIAKEEYERFGLNWMFRAAGCIPVDRSGRVEKAFRSALRAIKRGELVALFPQGKIQREDAPGETIKPGIVRLSQLSQCYILPVRIEGVGAPGTIAGSVMVRSNIQFEQHRPLSPEQSMSKDFRRNLSDWFHGNRDTVFENER